MYCSCIPEELIAADKTFHEIVTDPNPTEEQVTEAGRRCVSVCHL